MFVLFIVVVKLLFYTLHCKPKCFEHDCKGEKCPKEPADCLQYLGGALNGKTFDSMLLKNLFAVDVYDTTCKAANDFNLCLHNLEIRNDKVYIIVEKYIRLFAAYLPCRPKYKDNLRCMDEIHKKATNSCVSFCLDKYLKSKKKNGRMDEEFLTSCSGEKIGSSKSRSKLVESMTKVCEYRKCFERCIITRRFECPEEPYKPKKELYKNFLIEDTALYKSFKADLLYVQTGLFYNVDSCCVEYEEGGAFDQHDQPDENFEI